MTSTAALLRPATTGNLQKRIFVTQFDKEDDELLDPIARVSSAYKDKNKSRQMQQTVLLKYKVLEDEQCRNLINQRRQFQARMKACKEKQEDLLKKQNENNNRVKQFEEFINEKETKRKESIKMYQRELKSKLQKILEYDQLLVQYDQIYSKHLNLQLKLSKMQKFKDYLSDAIDLLPENYLESGDSKFLSLMLRFQTLEESNRELFDRLVNSADKLKDYRLEFEKLRISHDANKMKINSKLGELLKIKDDLYARNSQVEHDLLKNGDKYRQDVMIRIKHFLNKKILSLYCFSHQKTKNMGIILTGIDNLVEKCFFKKHSVPVKEMKLDSKLQTIQEYMDDMSLVLKNIRSNISDEQYQESLTHLIDD